MSRIVGVPLAGLIAAAAVAISMGAAHAATPTSTLLADRDHECVKYEGDLYCRDHHSHRHYHDHDDNNVGLVVLDLL